MTEEGAEEKAEETAGHLRQGDAVVTGFDQARRLRLPRGRIARGG
ncbi:hypothetical protein ACQ143_09795 [Microbacterium sp. MC2]